MNTLRNSPSAPLHVNASNNASWFSVEGLKNITKRALGVALGVVLVVGGIAIITHGTHGAIESVMAGT